MYSLLNIDNKNAKHPFPGWQIFFLCLKQDVKTIFFLLKHSYLPFVGNIVAFSTCNLITAYGTTSCTICHHLFELLCIKLSLLVILIVEKLVFTINKLLKHINFTNVTKFTKFLALGSLKSCTCWLQIRSVMIANQTSSHKRANNMEVSN